MQKDIKNNKTKKSFKVLLDNKEVLAYEGETILNLAKREGLNIPSLCHHPDLSIKANCRVCVVEVKGCETLKTSCSTLVEEGMEIISSNARVKRSREINLELIYASHVERCGACSYRYDCDLLKTAKDYELKITKFADRKKDRNTYKFANAVELDGTQCIDCRNCIEACVNQGISYLELKGSGINQEIVPKKDKNFACVYCGQCTLCCPVASAQEQDESIELEKIIKQGEKIVVAQLDPALKVSLGELFALDDSDNCQAKLITALRDLGFSYVFDINSAAKISAKEGALELIKRLDDNKAVFPVISSSCASTNCYIEFYHKNLIANLSNCRSPHIQGAGMIKKYFSSLNDISEDDIIVVSLVPCTAKKYEANRKELQLKGKPLVDYVLSTRELAFLLKKNNVDLKTIEISKNSKSREFDPLFLDDNKNEAILATNGGTMNSVLDKVIKHFSKNEASDKLEAKEPLEFKEVSGLSGVKEAEITLGEKKYKVASIEGLANFSKLIPSLKDYLYIELMACPDGCIGGGGQPIPTTKDIRFKRKKALSVLNNNNSLKNNNEEEDEELLKYLSFVKKNNLSKKLLHTKFKKSKGSVLKITKDNK